MVMDRNVDFTDSLDDYMEEGEMTGESEPFFADADLQNEFQAPTMVNPGHTSTPSRFEIPWKALRLPGARSGERGPTSAALNRIRSIFGTAQDIRSSPYAYVISAKTWTQYINNLDSMDIGAELNAPVSEHEKASLFLFAEEWRLDVTHEAFKRRLIDHSLVNVGDETAKGQMVFDLLTGGISQKGGRADTRYQSMFRLAMDLLQSIRLRYYNFYSVNLLHQHEGSALYEEFLSRYTPLAADEVAVIQEIDMGVRAKGRQYAVETTSPMTDAITSYNLMLRVIESYAMGDTMTARAGINVLLQAPISYKSTMKFTVNTDHLGRSALARDGDIVAAKFKIGGKWKEVFAGNAPMHYLLKKSVDGSAEWPDNLTKNNLPKEGVAFIEVNSISDPTPKNIITLRGSGDSKKFTSQSYADYLKLGRAAIKRDADIRAGEGQKQRRGRRSNVRSNPVAVGQGQHFFIRLKPKSQFSFTKQQKKMGATSKGTMTVVGTPGRDSTGLGDIFGGFEASGYVAWKGTNKETGVKQPWIIQLPRKFGKGPKRGKGGDTVFKKARVTDKDTGKSYSTIKPFNADPSTKAAWAKFVKTYGEPIYAEDPKRPNLFYVRKKNRGTYYKRK